MSTEDDLRRIALALPEVTEDPDQLAFEARGKGFPWSWKDASYRRSRGSSAATCWPCWWPHTMANGPNQPSVSLKENANA